MKLSIEKEKHYSLTLSHVVECVVLDLLRGGVVVVVAGVAVVAEPVRVLNTEVQALRKLALKIQGNSKVNFINTGSVEMNTDMAVNGADIS